MWRRFVYTLVGALCGYLLGAIVGMTAFAIVNGYRSVSILEESNRNRWTFIVASAAAVLGGLIAWWRSYSDAPPGASGEDHPVDGDGDVAASTNDAAGD